jgi:hypothetical protein
MERKKSFNANSHPHDHPHAENHSKTPDSRTTNRATTKFSQRNRPTSAFINLVIGVATHQTDNNRPRTQNVGNVISLLYPRSVKALAEQKQCNVVECRSKYTWQEGHSTLDLVLAFVSERLSLVFGRRKMLGAFRILCTNEDEGSSCTQWTETQRQYPGWDARGLETQDGDGLDDGVAEGVALVSTTPHKGRALPIQAGLDGWVASGQGQTGRPWLHKSVSPLRSVM